MDAFFPGSSLFIWVCLLGLLKSRRIFWQFRQVSWPERERRMKKAYDEQPEKTPNVRPGYVAERIGGSALGIVAIYLADRSIIPTNDN